VEFRENRSNKLFFHGIVGIGNSTGINEKISTCIGEITVDQSQILKIFDAHKIIKSYLENQIFPQNYSVANATDRFK
jgi:hypothetical protein